MDQKLQKCHQTRKLYPLRGRHHFARSTPTMYCGKWPFSAIPWNDVTGIIGIGYSPGIRFNRKTSSYCFFRKKLNHLDTVGAVEKRWMTWISLQAVCSHQGHTPPSFWAIIQGSTHKFNFTLSYTSICHHNWGYSSKYNEGWTGSLAHPHKIHTQLTYTLILIWNWGGGCR